MKRNILTLIFLVVSLSLQAMKPMNDLHRLEEFFANCGEFLIYEDGKIKFIDFDDAHENYSKCMNSEIVIKSLQAFWQSIPSAAPDTKVEHGYLMAQPTRISKTLIKEALADEIKEALEKKAQE